MPSTFPSCFRFNGSTDAQVSDTSLNAWTAQTISFWIWAASASANAICARVLEKGANSEWAIILNSVSESGQIFVQQLGGSTGVISSIGSVCDGNWHFVAVTIDATGLITLLVDNVSQGTAGPMPLPGAGGSPSGSNTAGALNIGQYGGGGYNFNGALNEIAIWNRVLTSDELATLWNAGQGVIGTTSSSPWNTGLEVLYHLNDGSGGTFLDSGPHGLNAIIEGTAAWVSPGAPVPLPIYGAGNPFDSQLFLGVNT